MRVGELVCGCVSAWVWMRGFRGSYECVQVVCLPQSLSVCLRLCETSAACLRAHVLDGVRVTQFRLSASSGLAPSPYPTLSV